MKRPIATALTVAALAVSTSCNWQPQRHDLEDVRPSKPDSVTLYLNVDDHPTLVRVCIDGVGVLTTSRDYDAAVVVPEWAEACEAER